MIYDSLTNTEKKTLMRFQSHDAFCTFADASPATRLFALHFSKFPTRFYLHSTDVPP